MAFKLPRLPVNWRQQPQLFERYWDEAMDRIEDTLNAILEIPAIQAALAAVDAKADDALADAAAASTAASAAQSTANSAQSEASIVNSYPANYLLPFIEADDTGFVTVEAHDRIYGDSSLNPTVSVNGGAIGTAASSGQTVRLFYDDPTRAGGTVSYQWTVDPTPPPVQGGNRHVIGTVKIPAAGTQAGAAMTPPGFVPAP